jgi:hypothetical protein
MRVWRRRSVLVGSRWGLVLSELGGWRIWGKPAVSLFLGSNGRVFESNMQGFTTMKQYTTLEKMYATTSCTTFYSYIMGWTNLLLRKHVVSLRRQSNNRSIKGGENKRDNPGLKKSTANGSRTHGHCERVRPIHNSVSILTVVSQNLACPHYEAVPTFRLATTRSKSTEVSTFATIIATITSAMGVEGRAMQVLTTCTPFSCCPTACSNIPACLLSSEPATFSTALKVARSYLLT